MKKIQFYSFLCVTMLLLSNVQAGITPGSKDLGAIWFIGDSITQSNADGDAKGSPRKSLYDLLKANGYTFTYTGHFAKNVDGLPATGSDVADNLYHYHSGVSGIRIGELGGAGGFASRLPKSWSEGRLAVVKPNVILIMLGTNDVVTPDGATDRLKKLIQDIYALPDVGDPTIFLGTIPPNRRKQDDIAFVTLFNDKVPGFVSEFKAQGKDIHLVDQFSALDKNYKANMRGDNLHPNAAGNEAMAQAWYSAISTIVDPDGAEVASAGELPGEKTDFKGFDLYVVKTAKGNVSVVCPKKAAPGKPWLWRSMFWKAIPNFHETDLKLVEEGYHVVIAPGHVYGHPKGNALTDAAYDLLTKEYGFSEKCSMASMSRETTALFRWAYTHPERVESIYVDNGVCNLRSWPGGKLVEGSTSKFKGNLPSWEGLKKAYGFTSDAEALAAKISPVDLLEPLAKAGVPILMVCGSKDTCCIYEEHDAIMEERYKKLGGSIKVIIEDKGHSHGMHDPTPVLEFIKKHRGR